MQVSQTGTITAEMNVTPMIDVLLVLIIVAIILLTLEAKLLLQVPADRKPPTARLPASYCARAGRDGRICD
jgi:biopolymer transport protein ExbD